jgi:uncharacterized membrane protein YeaQ/YmgE (transglycosylase-associated protein family)
MYILGWIVFGAFVGWLATLIMGKRGGGFLFRVLSGSFNYDRHGFIVSTLVAVIGAVIVLAIWNAITGHRQLR